MKKSVRRWFTFMVVFALFATTTVVQPGSIVLAGEGDPSAQAKAIGEDAAAVDETDEAAAETQAEKATEAAAASQKAKESGSASQEETEKQAIEAVKSAQASTTDEQDNGEKAESGEKDSKAEAQKAQKDEDAAKAENDGEKPAQTLETTAEDGTTITIAAPEGALPEGSVAKAVKANSGAVKSALESAAEAQGKELVDYAAYDITIQTAEGEEIQPDKDVKVTISGTDVSGDEMALYHVNGSEAEEVAATTVTDSKAVFTAEHFSDYVIVGEEDQIPEGCTEQTVHFYAKCAEKNVWLYLGSGTAELPEASDTVAGTKVQNFKIAQKPDQYVNKTITVDGKKYKSKEAAATIADSYGTYSIEWKTATANLEKDGWGDTQNWDGESGVNIVGSWGKTWHIDVPMELQATVTGLDVTIAESTITAGETTKVSATVTPEDAEVTWSSSNEDIATVDSNGKVTGVGAGTATITAKSGDKTESVGVTVVYPEQTVWFYAKHPTTGDKWLFMGKGKARLPQAGVNPYTYKEGFCQNWPWSNAAITETPNYYEKKTITINGKTFHSSVNGEDEDGTYSVTWDEVKVDEGHNVPQNWDGEDGTWGEGKDYSDEWHINGQLVLHYNKVTINYKAETGGRVTSDSETLDPVTAEEANGSTAEAEEGYYFVGWKDENGKLLAENPSFRPELPEGGWKSTTYTACFVPKNEVTVTAASKTVTYDGTEQEVSGFETDSLTFKVGDEDEEKYTISGLRASANGTKAGSYQSEVTGTAVVKDSAGSVVTDQFTVHTQNGKLTIEPAPLYVTTASAEKTYDGEALTAGGKMYGLVNDETATLNTTGTQTAVGSSPNTYEITWDGTAEEKNYKIEAEIGTLTVSAKDTTDTNLANPGTADPTDPTDPTEPMDSDEGETETTPAAAAGSTDSADPADPTDSTTTTVVAMTADTDTATPLTLPSGGTLASSLAAFAPAVAAVVPAAAAPAAATAASSPVAATVRDDAAAQADDGEQLITSEDEEVPLANQDLTSHDCCILHFLIMLLALVVLGLFTRSAKKRQRRIHQLTEELDMERQRRGLMTSLDKDNYGSLRWKGAPSGGKGVAEA